MNDIFNFFGSLLGYILWFFYVLVQNYGVAIILFTIAVKILLFPFSVKQQKTMAANSRMAVKQKELQKKYAKDKAKLQEETQKLYEKEGINPTGGCLTMALPMLILFGLFYTIRNPLANALHLSSTAIASATNMINLIPGVSSSFNSGYLEIEIVKNFAALQNNLTMFSAAELARISSFSHGFTFLGLNLLDTPCDPSNIFGTLFRSNLWVIPVGSAVVSVITQYFTMKFQPGMQQQQQGCMKYAFYLMPLFGAWFACTVPAAVGFYWIISYVVTFIQTIALNIWYNPQDLGAVAEARRVALLESEEAKLQSSGASVAQSSKNKGKIR